MLSDSDSSDSDNGIRFKTASTRNKGASFGSSSVGGGGGGGGGTSGNSGSSSRNNDSRRHSSSKGGGGSSSSYNDHRYDVNWKHSTSSGRSSNTNDHRYNNSPDRKTYDHRKKDDHRRRSASYERRRYRSRSKDRHSQHTTTSSTSNSNHRNKRSRSKDKEAVTTSQYPTSSSRPPPPPTQTSTQTSTPTTSTSIAQKRDDSINDDIKEGNSIKSNSSPPKLTPKEISLKDDDDDDNKQHKVKKAKHKKHKKGKKNESEKQLTIKSKTNNHKSVVTSKITTTTTKSPKTTDSHHTALPNGAGRSPTRSSSTSSSASSASASSTITSNLQIESINNVDSKIVCGPSLPPNFKLNRSSSKSPIITATSTPSDTPTKMGPTTNIESSILPLSNTPPPLSSSTIVTSSISTINNKSNLKNINVSSGATTSSCSSTSTLNLELLADDHIKHLMSDISDDSELDDMNLIGPLPPGSHSNSESVLQLEKRALELKLAKLKYDEDDDDDEDDDGDADNDQDGNGKNRNHVSHHHQQQQHHRQQHHRHQPQQKHREEWMIELPDIKAVADFGLGSRQFRTKERPDFSDRSSWTDTPQKKHSHKSNNTDDGKKLSRDELRLQKEKQAIAKRDSEQEKAAKHHKRKHKRDESLLDIHRKKLKDKKGPEDKKSERRPFSRENDLKVNKFDQKQKNAIIKKAQLLDTRFGRGESKYL